MAGARVVRRRSPAAGGQGPRREALLAAPALSGQRLRLAGMRPASLLEQPLHLRIAVNGHEVGRLEISRNRPAFDVRLGLPEAPGGGPTLRVVLRASRTDRAPGDARDLGVFLTRLAAGVAPPAAARRPALRGPAGPLHH